MVWTLLCWLSVCKFSCTSNCDLQILLIFAWKQSFPQRKSVRCCSSFCECWASTVSKGAGTGTCAFEQWYGLAVARCCMHPYVQFTVQPHSLSRSGCCNRSRSIFIDDKAAVIKTDTVTDAQVIVPPASQPTSKSKLVDFFQVKR